MSKSTKEAVAYYKDQRKLLPAAKAGLIWVRNPICEDGAKQLFRIAYNVLGPEIHRIAKRMRNNPETRKILDEGNDLGQTLADMNALDKLPENSLGKVYKEFMTGDDIYPGYIIGGLAYKDGHFDALADWDEDAKFLVLRVGNTHDMSHLLAGYGTDFPGEAMLIAFSVASNGMPVPLASFLGGLLGIIEYPVMLPKLGFFTWVSMFSDAAKRGAIMCKKNSLIEINYEELLDKPLEEVRELIGVPPHKHQQYVNDDGFLKSDNSMMRGWLGKYIQSGQGTKSKTIESVNRQRTLIESGFSIHDVMSAPVDNVINAYKALQAGDPKEKIFSELNDYQYT